jgi:hypothetical protein
MNKYFTVSVTHNNNTTEDIIVSANHVALVFQSDLGDKKSIYLSLDSKTSVECDWNEENLKTIYENLGISNLKLGVRDKI